MMHGQKNIKSTYVAAMRPMSALYLFQFIIQRQNLQESSDLLL